MFDENGNFIGFMLSGNQPNTPNPKGVYNPWTGIDTTGRIGGKDQYGRGIAATIPGGGAIAGIGQIGGGVAALAVCVSIPCSNKVFSKSSNRS